MGHDVRGGPATDAALALGAAMRLTRLVVTDDWGLWFIKTPLKERAETHGHPWPQYAEGLDCPFCVGYWIGVGVLASHAIARRGALSHRLWRFVAGTLALNEVAAHAGARLGDAG